MEPASTGLRWRFQATAALAIHDIKIRLLIGALYLSDAHVVGRSCPLQPENV
jgi:hypothetical protein